MWFGAASAHRWIESEPLGRVCAHCEHRATPPWAAPGVHWCVGSSGSPLWVTRRGSTYSPRRRNFRERVQSAVANLTWRKRSFRLTGIHCAGRPSRRAGLHADRDRPGVVALVDADHLAGAAQAALAAQGADALAAHRQAHGRGGSAGDRTAGAGVARRVAQRG